MLKKFTFELKDETWYQTHPQVISICQEKGNEIKFLLFKEQKQRQKFEQSKIITTDNYQIIDHLGSMEVCDNMILSKIYSLQDGEQACKRALKIQDDHRI